MAHAFAPIPAKPTFGSLNQNIYQSDYITRKKAKLTYCTTKAFCNKVKITNSYANLNAYNLGRYVYGLDTCNVIPINKGNLVMGQYTKLNLNGVCTVIPTTPCDNIDDCVPCSNNSPVPVNATNTEPFYFSNTIDPIGQLFGASQCGELNYTQNMVFYPPNGIPLSFS
jgi:hypothetical protein